MLRLQELEIYKQMQQGTMGVEDPLRALLSGDTQNELALQKPIHAPYWSLYLPFALVNKAQARMLSLWAQSRKVHHWMRALMQGEPLFDRKGDQKLIQPRHLHYRRKRLNELNTHNTQPLKKPSPCKELLDKMSADQLLVCGMGGSSIGAMALDRALQQSEQPNKSILYLTTTDPFAIKDIVEKIRKDRASGIKTALVLISKSGSTSEVLSNLQTLQSSEIDFERVIAITEKNSSLWNNPFVTDHLEMDPLIGGRFSSSSILGEFLLSFRFSQKVYQRFLQGAVEMDEHLFEDGPWQNLPLSLALIRQLHSAIRGQAALCIAPYRESLAPFVKHIQQLEMESLGKRVDLQGRELPADLILPVLFGGPGPQCQHTYFQWLHQSTQKIPVEFLFQIEECHGQVDREGLSSILGQMLALASGQDGKDPAKHMEGGRSSWLLATKVLSAESIGALLALYEHSTVYQSLLLGINAFDQEGVELGKQISSNLFDHLQSDVDDFWSSLDWKELTKAIKEREGG